MVIDAEATRLDRLVGGILHLGRITAGEVHPDLEPHEPWAIVEPAVDRLRPALGDRPIVVDVPDDLPPVLVDAALLDDVISNLIDNAAKHAPAPAPLEIHAGHETVRTGIVIVVEDGGPGVPASALARPVRSDRSVRATATSAVDAAWASACPWSGDSSMRWPARSTPAKARSVACG